MDKRSSTGRKISQARGGASTPNAASRATSDLGSEASGVGNEPDREAASIEEIEALQAYFDRDDELTDDEETHYRWLLRVVADQ